MDIKKFVLSYYSNATEDFYIKEITKPREALSLHTHEYYQIYYVQSGKLTHSLENGSAELKARDVFIIPPNMPHYIKTESKDLRFYSICFMPSYIIDIVKSNKLVADFMHCITDLSNGRVEPSLTLLAEDIELTDTLVLKIMKEFSSNTIGKVALIKSSLSLILSIFARAYLGARVENVRFSSDREIILHCLGYIKNHLSEHITLQEMAKRTAMSKSSFCKNFREITGESFNNYLNRERVEKAATLIKSGKLVISAAMELGYSDISTFYRNFKKHFGISPSEYK